MVDLIKFEYRVGDPKKSKFKLRFASANRWLIPAANIFLDFCASFHWQSLLWRYSTAGLTGWHSYPENLKVQDVLIKIP